jgi:5-oxopent-3-ene-1,2,5-tricarboxylate decarboxylase/2-hydroxyhepta-2,4-diene-1,7-dioate isomerase
VKRARFLAAGRYHEGLLAEPGVLVDEAGNAHLEDDVVFLPPLDPGTAIGLAINYADHAAELEFETPEDPVLFLKPSNTWVGHRAEVAYPNGVEYLHYEAELAVVIAQRCRRVSVENAFEVVLGYTIVNDVTARDFLRNYFRPPVRVKGWDSFGPIGPYLVEGEIDDPSGIDLRTYVNDELRQQGNTNDLIFGVPELIEHITSFMTLERGDLILTGTPKGISHVYPGDLMRIEIDGLGVLENRVVAERSASVAA